MAEIKSTLDIIMERTKNLTMTDKEKASFREKETEGRVKGWIQKYQDGVIGLDALLSDFEKETRLYPEVRQILRSQLTGCLRLTGDNEKILRLLEEVLGIDTGVIKDMIQSLKHEMEAQRIRRIKGIGEELKKREIYGSAVVPNPEYGDDWQKSTLAAESELKRRLKSIPR